MSSITIIVCTLLMLLMLTSMSLQALLNFLISSKTIFNASIRLVYIVSLALSASNLVITFTSALLSSIVSTYMFLTFIHTFSVAAAYVFSALCINMFSTFATITSSSFLGMPLNISFTRDSKEV